MGVRNRIRESDNIRESEKSRENSTSRGIGEWVFRNTVRQPGWVERENTPSSVTFNLITYQRNRINRLCATHIPVMYRTAKYEMYYCALQYVIPETPYIGHQILC